MATINVWSKVAVAVQTVLAAAKTITAITKANPAVATSTTHGYTNGDVLLLKISGMTQLDYRVVRAAGVTANDFQLEGVDSTSFDTFVSGTAEKITFGATASTLQDINGSGGEAESIGVSTIHDDQNIEIPGNRTPIVYNFGSLWDPGDAALKQMQVFDNSKTAGCLQITFATGAKLYFAAYMSAPLVPVGSAGQPVTTPVTFRLRGRITNYTS
ncbi:MAG: phage tail tube protein [Burkholderiaceae bacterium]